MKRTGHDGRPSWNLFAPPLRFISGLHETTVDARRNFEGDKKKKKPERTHSAKMRFREVTYDDHKHDSESDQGIGAAILELPIHFQTHHQEHEGEEKNGEIAAIKVHLQIAIVSGRSHPNRKAIQDTLIVPNTAKAQSKDGVRFQGQQFAPDVGSTSQRHITTHAADYPLANAEHVIE